MASVIPRRLRARPAHPPGPTAIAFTPNGKRLVTVGDNDAIRVFTSHDDGEPRNLDGVQESNLTVAANDAFFVVGSEDGMVLYYSLSTFKYEKALVRCSLPVRSVDISPDGKWVAVASDELVVKLVNVEDITKIHTLREQPKPAKHVSFHPEGTHLAVSGSDGIVYVYALGEEPRLLRKVDGVIRALENESDLSSRVVWHPDGRAFAAQTPTKDVQVVSQHDWEKQRAFSGSKGHGTDIRAIAWSPNAAILATSGLDGSVMLWDTKTQSVFAKYEYADVVQFVWHPTENIACFCSANGEVFIFENFVQPDHLHLLQKPMQPAPFFHEPLSEISSNTRKLPQSPTKPPAKRRRASLDSIENLLADDDDDDGFVEDDDGAGYVSGNVPRTSEPDGKRRALNGTWAPKLHEAFQPGSTDWRGNRRYLCLNLTGTVWTVDQDTYNTITVEFYDRDLHRDFHFNDYFHYDKACLNEHGALFSSPVTEDARAAIFYRPHETWTARSDWRTELPEGEEILSISLSDSHVVVLTSRNYVRVYTLFGTPWRLYRHKSAPGVACASWRDYVLTMGNGPLGANGQPSLVYSIENVKTDEVCQNEDVVSTEGSIQTVFFSDEGDPCIFDESGVLLMLQHWRTPGQARWVPVLDTTTLERLATGRKEENYWPVAVAGEKFHCIILKGGDKTPYFPRPLLSEFDLRLPVSDPTGPEGGSAETAALEESFVRQSLFFSLASDADASRVDLARRQMDVDKTLLHLLATECRAGDEHGMKALELVGLLGDQSGKMLEAAGKVAGRFGRRALEERIRSLAERRLLGED